MGMSRDDQALWDAIAAETENTIEDRARDRDEMRERYADILGKNRYANRDFEALVDSMFDAFPRLEERYARSNDRLEDFLHLAVEDIVDGHFANSVLSNRRTADELDNRTFNEMQDMADLYKELLSSRGRGRGRDERGRDDRDDRGRGGRGGGSGYGRAREQNIGRTATTTTGSWRNRGKDQRSQRAASGGAWDAVARAAADTQDVVEEVRREPVKAAPVVEAPPAPSRPVLEGPDFTKARPYDEFLENNEHWVVASKSKWKIAFNYDNPLASVPKLYDARALIKYHVQSEDGKVREEFIKVTDDNRYLAHEALNDPQRYHSTNPRRSSSAISLSGTKAAEEDVVADVPTKPSISTLQEGLQRLEQSQFSVSEDGAYLAETLNGLVFNTRLKMMPEHESQRLNICYRNTPVAVTSWRQEELVNEVYNCHNLAAAAEKLLALQGEFDAQLWTVLNNRFSELTLRAVRFQFQENSVKALSFANDWTTLIKHLEKIKGEGFASDFAQRTSYIVPVACSIAARDDLGAFTQQDGADLPCVVFLDQSAIICLDTTLDTLGIGKTLAALETGASITSAADQSLTNTVRLLYGKLDDKAASNGACRVYINTNEGALLELIPFAARKENFILVAVK